MKKNVLDKNPSPAPAERFLYDYGHGTQWRSMRLRVALGFPAPYRVGMSNLGFLWVYHLLNREPGVRCDRFFAPEPGAHSAAVTIETGRALNLYDVVAFSLPYEQDYPVMVNLLRRGGVEPFAEKRHNGPLVLAGGTAVSANPEPVADFLDLAVIGEAEPVVAPLLETLFGADQSNKKAMLRNLAEIRGLYVPALYEVTYKPDGTIENITPDTAVEAAISENIIEPAHAPIVSEGAAFKSMFLVELSRGCPHKCRFCLTRYTGHGFRAAGADALVKAVESGLAISNRVGLVGTAFAEGAAADAVCGAIQSAGGRASFSSLRLTGRVLKIFEKWSNIIDNETLTVAPEVATERLKKVLDKDIGRGIGKLLDGPMPEKTRALKLYYMVGVPGETREDVDAISRQAMETRDAAVEKGMKVSVSVNPLVPKAHTPLQWIKPLDRTEVKERLGRIKRSLSGHGVTVTGMGAREAEIQTMLSLGDRRLAPVLADVAETDGAASDYETALRAHGLKLDFYAHRARTEHEILPWSRIDHGASLEALWGQYLEATAQGV